MITNKLQKELSPVNVWALALGCIIGWGAFVMPGNTFLVKAGPLGTAIAMGIAAFIMIIIALNYNYMINIYQAAGGEFTYTQKAFGNKHAFICSWFLGLSYLAIVPLNATALALIGRKILNNVFQVGLHYNVAGYEVYFGEIMLAVVALVLFALLSIRGVKFTGFFQTTLVFILVTGILIITIAAFMSSKASFSELSPLFSPAQTKLAGILAVIAVAPWAFIGFDTIPQSAEEFNFSPKKTKIIMILSIVFGAFVYIILNTVTAVSIPVEYSSWNEYISDIPNLNGLISLPTFHASYELLGKFGLCIIGFAVLCAILSGIIGFYMATSRLLYSMAKENVIPKWFGKIHSRYGTPSNAILFIMFISLFAPLFGRTVLGWIVDMSSTGAAIAYGYTSLAALYFAKRSKNIKIITTGILGMILSVCFMILLIIPIPLFNTSLSKESYICLLIWCILGLIFYCISSKNRKRINFEKQLLNK